MNKEILHLMPSKEICGFIKNYARSTDAKTKKSYYSIPICFEEIADGLFVQHETMPHWEQMTLKLLLLKMKERIEDNDPYYENFFNSLFKIENELLDKISQTIK
ncbi:MAG: hypothetical protein B7Y11_13720 [Sphingobacteriia bacterium 24-36-13]|nr:MAG: hypothetical protein B7Y11_13720 [Sphingobacteriia bacterium 24-36-13]